MEILGRITAAVLIIGCVLFVAWTIIQASVSSSDHIDTCYQSGANSSVNELRIYEYRTSDHDSNPLYCFHKMEVKDTIQILKKENLPSIYYVTPQSVWEPDPSSCTRNLSQLKAGCLTSSPK